MAEIGRRRPSILPGVAIAEQGVVLLDGPQGIVVSLTPEAAAATGESLRRAASLAERQRGHHPDADTPVPLHPTIAPPAEDKS